MTFGTNEATPYPKFLESGATWLSGLWFSGPRGTHRISSPSSKLLSHTVCVSIVVSRVCFRQPVHQYASPGTTRSRIMLTTGVYVALCTHEKCPMISCGEIPASSLTTTYICFIEARQTQPASSFSSSVWRPLVQLLLPCHLVALWRRPECQSP